MSKSKRGFLIYLAIICGIVLVVSIILQFYTDSKGIVSNNSYSTLIQKINENQVNSITVQRNKENDESGKAVAQLKDGSALEAEIVVNEFMSYIHTVVEQNPSLTVELKPTPKTSPFFSIFLMVAIMIVVVLFLTLIMQQVQSSGSSNGRMMSFGKSKAKMNLDTTKKVTFESVAGLAEEKEELQELVEFLKTPKKFVELGARIPKGVLLVGVPGTGKTLLAKAVAGEADVPFFSISGSDFVEMFVGVGASRVRDLFEQAKKNSPCIVFIDEIDAVGRRRGAGLGGGHDEREQTLNQLLVEMDGFGVNEGVIIVAATNRPDILDPALLRPGRFDRRVVVQSPDVKGREEILQVHVKGKPLADDVNLKSLAHSTSGFTGADLENLMNEAALLTARDGKAKIDMEEIRKAFIRVGVGTEKKSRVIPKKDRRITAYHEAGHAIIQEVLEELDPVHSISIIPTGSAGGYTMWQPDDDRTHLSKRRMEQEIVSLLGGRSAEHIVFDDITTGASNDIERATAIARNMVTRYGMSEQLGPILFGGESEEIFIGRDWGHSRNYGEDIASVIDAEIKRIVETAYQRASDILKNHRDLMDTTAQLLLEKEKITGDEFRVLFPEALLAQYKKAKEKVAGKEEESDSDVQLDLDSLSPS